MNLLLIEDDLVMARVLQDGLKSAGHAVTHLANGREGLVTALTTPSDAIILDRMLPVLDGLSILQSLRAAHVDTPVIVLTALGQLDERLKCLQLGADDYIVKPFEMVELLTRIDVVTRRLRRSSSRQETLLSHGSLRLNRLTREVTRAGQLIELTNQEIKILELLLENPGQLVSYKMLAEHVWDYNFLPQQGVIRVHIAHLRAKLEVPGLPQMIHTVRGQGFRLHEGT